MRQLSASFTFFYKYIFILLWLAFFAFAIASAASSDRLTQPSLLTMIGAGMVGALFILAMTGSIKKVVLDGSVLHVSNFLRTETIDTAALASISGTTMLSPTLVWFTLKEPCSFGSRIVFMPRARRKPGFGKHPLVFELQQELGL